MSIMFREMIGRLSEYSYMNTTLLCFSRQSTHPMRMRGFSLIEVVIVIAILGLLVAIAYPSYLSYVTKTRRSEAKTALLDLQQRMERFFLDRNTYTTATIGSGNASTDVLPTNLTENGRYTLQISATSNTPPSYTIQAIPQGADPECGTFTLNGQGVRGITGTGTIGACW